ncbi:MAG: hypothetical protein PHY42_06495 [Bacilli bacterium]|nr:hypothetical protein [Bacilli bacterium]
MEPIWVEDVKSRINRNNTLLFTSLSPCLNTLSRLFATHSHQTLILWAFTCVSGPLRFMQIKYPNVSPLFTIDEICKKWSQGLIKMKEAKATILALHHEAKCLMDSVDASIFHGIAQAYSCIHTPTHVLGLPIYELTSLVRHYGLPRAIPYVEEKVREYQETLLKVAGETHLFSWASFIH